MLFGYNKLRVRSRYDLSRSLAPAKTFWKAIPFGMGESNPMRSVESSFVEYNVLYNHHHLFFPPHRSIDPKDQQGCLRLRNLLRELRLLLKRAEYHYI